jgi:hypothetical protein
MSQPSKLRQSEHRKMFKKALEMDGTVLSLSEFTKACAELFALPATFLFRIVRVPPHGCSVVAHARVS